MVFMFTSLKGLLYVGFATAEMQDMVNFNLIQLSYFAYIGFVVLALNF